MRRQRQRSHRLHSGACTRLPQVARLRLEVDDELDEDLGYYGVGFLGHQCFLQTVVAKFSYQSVDDSDGTGLLHGGFQTGDLFAKFCELANERVDEQGLPSVGGMLGRRRRTDVRLWPWLLCARHSSGREKTRESKQSWLR